MTRLEKRNLRNGLLFISPWLIGFVLLQIYPIAYTFYLSLTEYSGFGKAVFTGLNNYRELFTDTLFYTSIKNTLYYACLMVPINMTVAICIALAMNQHVKEVSVYRAILYLPSILPAFALVFVWILFTNPQYGLLNTIFRWLHLPFIDWIGDARYTKLSLILLAQYGAGGPALIVLAALRAIPAELYESAEIDGAGIFKKLFSITIPIVTPIILFNVIRGLSGALQVFMQAYILTSGGDRTGAVGSENSLYFYVLYIFNNAFKYSRMGYAAAQSVLFFIFTVLIALLIFRWGRSWVHYENAA
jgi:multiple sugar transport system permease protein